MKLQIFLLKHYVALTFKFYVTYTVRNHKK
jgi:hypothetical protein